MSFIIAEILPESSGVQQARSLTPWGQMPEVSLEGPGWQPGACRAARSCLHALGPRLVATPQARAAPSAWRRVCATRRIPYALA